MSKIVFDIETKNTFSDIGGKRNLGDFEMSVVGVYSYDKDEYICYDENNIDELGELLKKANPLIGYSSKKFDVPVLEKYFDFKLSSVPHFDIHEELESRIGRKVSLNNIGEANIGLKKTASHGLKAIEMYNKGEIEKLKEYCLQDVRITKEVFDHIIHKGFLWVPRRNIPQMEKVSIDFKEEEDSQAKLL